MGKAGVKQRHHEDAKAGKLGISRMTLNRYRRGLRKMSPEIRRKLKAIDREYLEKEREDTNGR